MCDYDELMDKAYKLMFRLHEGQLDKGGHPYHLHPERVSEHCSSPKAKVAGLLHDVIEDGDYHEEQLVKDGFPEDIAHAVALLSHLRHEPYMEYVGSLAPDPIAREVKMADLNDNMNLERLGREPNEKDLIRLAKYKKAFAYLKDFDGHQKD
jgi:(p)ppGpp synthase/HD superfamily hydrolase